MATQTVTLQIADPLYQRLQARAAQSARSVEEEVLELVALGVPETENLADEHSEALSQLQLLEDGALWRAARMRIPQESSSRLEELHLKRQRDGLNHIEEREVAELLRQYERVMLVRAEAAVLLKQRGHNISSLAPSV